MDWHEYIEMFLRWFYYVASIALVFSLFLGIKQLKVLQKDISIRNQRAAFEKTIEYMDWYSEFLNTQAKFYLAFEETKNKLKSEVKNPKYHEQIDSITISTSLEIDHDDTFLEYSKDDYEMVIRASILRLSGAVHILNQLEIFAAVMLCKIADEEMAFTPLSDIYCVTICEFYPVLCEERSKNPKLYSNTVGLYSLWKERIVKATTEKELDEKIEKWSKLKDNKIKPLGV